MYLDLCNKLGAKFYFSKNAPHPSYLLAIFVVDLMMHFEFSKYLDKLQILPPFKKLTRAGQTLANALFSPLYTSVMRVGTDTFGDPIFQNGLQN